MNKLTLDDLDVRGHRVLTRVDYNVPLREGAITDDSRIRASLPTLQALRDGGARIVLISHLGRPKGEPDARYSLEPVARRLAELMGEEIRFVNDCVGGAALEASEKLEPGGILLLENLRFHPEEEENGPGFSQQLGELGELYVNDAFGAAHRAHASTVGVTKHIRRAAAGRLMEQELHFLGTALADPEKPYVAILGGAKISGKIEVLQNLMPIVDRILIGGGMTYTFYAARDIAIGDSLIETDRVDLAKDILGAARKAGVEIVLPEDSVVCASADGSEPYEVTPGPEIPDGLMGVDIGPRTRERFRAALADARTVVWNGPLGVFEVEAFAEGTLSVARDVASVTARGGITVVGGGDSVAAIHRAGMAPEAYSHVSTGGGAFLEFLEGQELPGVAALTDRS